MMCYEMATKYNNAEVYDDFIDLELFASPNFFFYNTNPSPPLANEFEFQKCFPNSNDLKDTTNSVADELFHEGKLLPHFYPPFQMLDKQHHQNPTTSFQQRQYFTNNNTRSNKLPNNRSQWDQSLNIVSPQETACRISIEPSADGFIELSGFINSQHPKKTRSKNKLFKKSSSIALKLKASRAYLKSLFSKSGCNSDESSAKPAAAKEYSRAIINVDSCPKINRASSSSCGSSASSQSFSFVSEGGYDQMQLIKKSNSTTTHAKYSEVDSSIEAAIAHCKKSFDELKTKNNDEGFLSYSVSRNATCSWDLVRAGGGGGGGGGSLCSL